MTYPNFSFDKSRPIDLIAMGRVAVDLYAEQIGSNLAEASSFRKYLGGCAGNIAVGAARLGLKSMMLSCVGQDEMGNFLRKTLIQEGVNIDWVYQTDQHLTGLVLLGVKPPHDFPLMFYRNDCADMQLKPQHINLSSLQQAKALLITGTGLSTTSMQETTHHSIQLAKQANTAIILDLDYRPVLWQLTAKGNGETRFLSNRTVTQSYQTILADCDLIVGTEEELLIAGGSEEFAQALSTVRALNQHAPIVVKTGAKGCQIYFANQPACLHGKPYPVPILNVLGAGDGFMAGLLKGLLSGESWPTAASFANACGALVVTRHGCSVAIPYWPELLYFLQNYEQDPQVWQSAQLAKLHQPQIKSDHSLLIKYPQRFDDGMTAIVNKDSPINTGMNFSAIKLRASQQFNFNPQYEFAALLMTGRVVFHYQQQSYQAQRSDYFAQNPIILHGPAGINAKVEALTDCEILLIETENAQHFEPLIFDHANLLELDHRGQGILNNTSYRLVRTAFDKRNRPQSNLVLGEIVTLPGRWSSYPPHAHPQPEIYHYRFSEPQGFAFGENGQEVLRIEHNDTYQIATGQTHAHCCAPGYAMYTLWFIRHLDHDPYTVPIFSEEHEWTRHTDASLRQWLQPASFCRESL